MLCYLCFFSLNELLRVNEELSRERDERLKEITELREKLVESQNKDQSLEAQQTDLNEKIQEVLNFMSISILFAVIATDMMHFTACVSNNIHHKSSACVVKY